jgi:hypothetical protein
VSLILKSPVGDTVTPLRFVLLRAKLGEDEQLNWANTARFAGMPPAPFPPARTSPFPETWMLPLALTVAFSLLIVQIWPPGCWPRTTFRTTVPEPAQTIGDVEVDAGHVTGSTPIPRLNVKLGLFPLFPLPSAAAGPAVADIRKALAATAANTLTKAYRFMIFPFTRL